MDSYKYEPTVNDGKPQFDGHLEFRIPSTADQFELFGQIGMKFVDGAATIDGNDNELYLMAKIMKQMSPFLKGSTLVHVSSGVCYKKWDDILAAPECKSVCIEAASKFLGTFSPDPN